METHREIERKYDVKPTSSIPQLNKLPGVARVEQPHELELEAVYFDTEEHALMRAGITLRRRTGGDDEGWHVKLPLGPNDREEFRLPLRRGAAGAAVPKALRSLVEVHARGRRLVPVATVRNRRMVHRMVAKDGTALAELCDDHVTAEPPDTDGCAPRSTWREWEVELVHGSPALLAAVDTLVREAGARPSGSSSKLARALGSTRPKPSKAGNAKPTDPLSAGAGVLAYYREQADRLKAADPQVRLDRHDSVHAMRVATRRLRSVFATFRPLLDRNVTDHLRGELKWLAGVLGEARDAEVLRDRLTAMAAEDAEDQSGVLRDNVGHRGGGHPAVSHGGDLGGDLGARYRTAHDEVLRVLDSARYFRLLNALDALLDSPPWTSAADEPAQEVLRTLVRRDWRRVDKRALAAAQAATPTERDGDLHELRKAAKRLRYSCEAVAPIFGDRAATLGKAAKDLQEVLGEHQDSVASQKVLHQLASQAGLPRESAGVLGRLHLMERRKAERAQARYEATWRQASDKRHRRWLTG